MWSIATATTTIAKSFTDPEIPLSTRFAAFALVLLLGACGNSASPAANAGDSGYYNIGNCFDNGRVGYARDYSYGERYLSGQNRAC